MSELYVPIDGAGDPDLLSATCSTFAEGSVAGQTMQSRPRSAPKHSSRKGGFWNKKGNPSQDDVLLRKSRGGDTDSSALEKMYSVDGSTLVQSSHQDLTTMARSEAGAPGTSNSCSKDAKDSANTCENQGGPPPLTREEFEALPLAIQRKYFSTLERLRFAQEYTDVDGIYNHYDDITSHKNKRRKHASKRSGPDPSTLRDSTATTSSEATFLNVPEKPKNPKLTREEQCELVRHLRASVILDAADEAVYNRRYKSSNNLTSTPEINWSTPTLLPRRGSLDSMSSTMIRTEPIGKGDPARESLYESFRWLDEEDDLDLRLFLDDYHANLREELPATSKNRQPTFRRHLSISKLPFGRPSFSTRTDAKDATDAEPPVPSLTVTPQTNTTDHNRRRSRTLSLKNANRQAHIDSLSPIDSAAAHYQDPEARLKLRVYLASPQKFDEAIEFGFPAKDAVGNPTIEQRRSVLKNRQSRQNLNDDADTLHTFLDDADEDDEELSDIDDDASSISDLDSPKTPQLGGLTPPPGHHRPTKSTSEPLHPIPARRLRPQASANDSLYTAIPASSREMTLRMTLTRPDLRADDDLIYGWQAQQQQQQETGHLTVGSASRPLPNALRDDGPTSTPVPSVVYAGQGRPHKAAIEAILTGNGNGNEHHPPEVPNGDKNFMKRIFNRVRRA